MKGFKKLLLFVMMAALLLTGCKMKESIDLSIKSDKSVDMGITLLLDDEAIDTFISFGEEDSDTLDDIEDADDISDITTSKTYTDTERWKYLDEEVFSSFEDAEGTFKKTKYDKDGMKGYILTYTFDSIDDLTGTGDKINFADLTDSDEPILFTKSGNVYTSNIEYSPTGEDASEYSSQMDAFEMTFSVTLPNKPLTSNADKTSSDGKTLTWDLSDGLAKDISYSFEFGKDGKSTGSNTTGKTTTTTTTNSGDDTLISNKTQEEVEGFIAKLFKTLGKAVVFAIIGGILLLVLIIVVIIVAVKGAKKKNNAASINTAAQTAPVQPVQPVATAEPVQQPVAPAEAAPVQQPTEPAAPAEPTNTENKQ